MKPNPECLVCGLMKSTIDGLAPFGPQCVKGGKHEFPATKKEKISRKVEAHLHPKQMAVKPHFTADELSSYLSFFIDEEFPKGASQSRGHAILHIALFISWLQKNVTKTK